MDRIFDITSSDQHQVEARDSVDYTTALRAVPQTREDKGALLAVVAGYLPILALRIDGLSKQQIAIGTVCSSARAEQNSAAADVATIAGKGFVNNLQSRTLAYAQATPEGKKNMAAKLSVTAKELDDAMILAHAVFETALRDASVLSDRDIGLTDFYTKYVAHLQKVQDRISAELVTLSYIQTALVAMHKVITQWMTSNI